MTLIVVCTLKGGLICPNPYIFILSASAQNFEWSGKVLLWLCDPFLKYNKIMEAEAARRQAQNDQIDAFQLPFQCYTAL